MFEFDGIKSQTNKDKHGIDFVEAQALAELDKIFDEGEDITPYMDFSTARRPNKETQRVNLDLTPHILKRLDAEAQRIGVPRQSLIKVWLAERLDML